MLQKIGAVSYKLDPPPESKIIRPVFHVFYLKLKLGQQVTPIPTLPPIDESGQITTEPMALLQSRTSTLRSRTIAAISTILSSPCGQGVLNGEVDDRMPGFSIVFYLLIQVFCTAL